MASPILKNSFAQIRLKRSSSRPIFRQLADSILGLIRQGHLKPAQKLPSSRELSNILGINRITVLKALEELSIEGWLESHVGRGTFVSAFVAEAKGNIAQQGANKNGVKKAGFSVNEGRVPIFPYFVPNTDLHLDDGYPDPRLAPLKELYRSYRNQLSQGSLYARFGSYSYPDGSVRYREAISRHLNESRGLRTNPGNILSVRGTLMAINLICTALLKPGDTVVSGVPGWSRAEQNFTLARAKHIGVEVDEQGLVVEELKKICKKRKVRMVYITPHHHYPTTVPLRIDRRLELLNLANEYGFIILEDDYDFDFHYSHRPLQPLASADENGMVIYCGSFSKSFSPAFRIGYLAASENVIKQLANIRLLMDRQGDHVLDNAMASLLNDGTIQRYIRRTLPVYRERRDYFCGLLQNELADRVSFSCPEGGMSVWTKFDKSISLEQMAKLAYQKGLFISDGKSHTYRGLNENAIRLGFASSSIGELQNGIKILKKIVNKSW